MPNETIPVAGLGSGGSQLDYLVPGGLTFDLMAAFATFDGSGAAGSFLPALQILSPTGDVMASTVGSSVAAGGSADVTFAPFLEEEVAAETGALFNRNLGELGYSIGATLATAHTHTIQIQDVLAGDGVLVTASAPSLPVGGGTSGYPSSCTDSKGNSYSVITAMTLEDVHPAVNTGMAVWLFFCQSSIAPLAAGVDTITVTWDNQVYDRIIGAYLVRHDGGTVFPTVLGQTTDNNTTVYAASQVTQRQSLWAPDRDEGFSFALIYSARSLAGGSVAFGGVAGWTGFYEAGGIAKTLAGSQQSYSIHPQTHDANVYIQIGPTITTNEIDLGTEPANVLQHAFNGVGQLYVRPFPTPEVNVWKGIIIMGLD